MKTSDTVSALFPALIDCWKAFPNLKPEGHGYNYKYVELNKVLDIAKDVLPHFGLAAIQFPESTDSQDIGVTTRIIHNSGEWIEGTVYATPTNMKGINQTQATGATITYLRRYGLLSVLGATGDKDTDGRADKEPENSKMLAEYHSAINGCGDLDSLKNTFASAWKDITDPVARKYITNVYNDMKAKL